MAPEAGWALGVLGHAIFITLTQKALVTTFPRRPGPPSSVSVLGVSEALWLSPDLSFLFCHFRVRKASQVLSLALMAEPWALPRKEPR